MGRASRQKRDRNQPFGQLGQAGTVTIESAADITRRVFRDLERELEYQAIWFPIDPLALWCEGAMLHRIGCRLGQGLEKLQDPATPRLPAGTSTLRWAETWAKEQKSVQSKSVWQQMKEKLL